MSISVTAAAAIADGHGADGPLAAVGLARFAELFGQWLTLNDGDLAPLLGPFPDFDERVAVARRLRRKLFDAGWGRYGWPPRVGGLGGSILHRGIVHEELTRRGWPGPANFEHLEIIAPTLVQFADPSYAAEVIPSFLSGDEAWAQGFSNPKRDPTSRRCAPQPGSSSPATRPAWSSPDANCGPAGRPGPRARSCW
jgi:alkylation response protein AidB-like acyl-CoA dehydrogenase